MQNETMVFGTKPEIINFSRKNVRVVLYNPKTDLFAVQYVKSWDEYGILGGGIEEGHTELETASKELIEESGYVDFEIVTQLGGRMITYFTNTKASQEERRKGNQERISTGFLAILKSEKNIGLKLEEYEVELGSSCVWRTKEEISEVLEKQTETDFSYVYFLETFKRGLEYLKEMIF